MPAIATVEAPEAQRHDRASFQLWLSPNSYYAADEEPEDEHETYMSSRPVTYEHPIEWWRANLSTYPKLAQMAFDLLSIGDFCRMRTRLQPGKTGSLGHAPLGCRSPCDYQG